MYKNEIEMYPDIIRWLTTDLKQRFGKKAKRIQVLDTHDSDLSNFIMRLNYQKFFPEFTTFQIRQDITGFIEYVDKVELVFVECKNSTLSLINLSQLIGYSSIALPLYAILLSHSILQDQLRNYILLQFLVMFFHLLLIIRVMITYLKNIYNQIKEFMNNKKKVNDDEPVSLKDSKRKVHESKRMVRKRNKTMSHKVSNRNISKPKRSPNRK